MQINFDPSKYVFQMVYFENGEVAGGVYCFPDTLPADEDISTWEVVHLAQ